MGILEKYQIVSMLGTGETSSFRAQEVSTGRPVVVHQFLRGQTSVNQPDLMSMVLKYLSRADAPGIPPAAPPPSQPEVDEFDLMFNNPGGQKPAAEPSPPKPLAPLPPPEP